jgi:hypothetical protein
MKRSSFRHLISAAVVALAAGAVAPVQAAAYSSVVIFGDSLSDNGNNALAGLYDPSQVVTGNTYVPSATYAPAMTYTNGPVWATYFGNLLGVPILPSLAGGTDFAFGGATTGHARDPARRLSVQPADADGAVPRRDRQLSPRRARCTSWPAAATTPARRWLRWPAVPTRQRPPRPPRPRSRATSARSSTSCRPPAPSTSSSGTRRTSASRRPSRRPARRRSARSSPAS